MKKNNVQIGAVYKVKVTGKIAEVRITGENPSGGWNGVNVITKRKVRIKSAQRLRSLAHRQPKRNAKPVATTPAKVAPCGGKPTRASKKAKAKKPRDTGKRVANVAKTVEAVQKGNLADGITIPIDKKHKPMSLLAAAVCVMKACDRPLGCKDIIAKAMETNIWQPRNGGKTPANTLHAAVNREIKLKGKDARFRKTERGKFELAK
ncbi:MAG: winged helix-turn-helix domain-containing protein [Phycisphaerae bacterium]|nr:winged helix-turn-helix domain-containing protein [Phycisphaerae bacterium]